MPALRLRRRAAIAAALAIAAIAAPSASAAEPIEGSWFFDGGEILVEPTGEGAFRGTVVRPTRLAECTHPVGERIWSITGSGSHYTGTHQWFRSGACTPHPGGQTTWDVAAPEVDQQTLRLCTRNPDVGGPPALDAEGNPLDGHTRCFVLARARPPLARPTFRRVVAMPPRRTTTGCRTSRRIRVRLRDPQQDPLVAIVVRVNGKVVRRVRDSAPRRIVLRGLPRRRVTVAIVARTATGKTLRGKRAFRACPRLAR